MAYDWRKEIRSTIDGLSVSLSIILILAFAGSLLARLGWLFDLGNHFVIQYLIGALILTPLLLCLGQKRLALVVFIIGIGSGAEIYQYHHRYYQAPTPAYETDKTITVAQYNRLAAHFKHTTVTEWLRNNSFDIVVLQEANPSLSKEVYQLRDIYPYQLHEPRNHAFGMVLLSRHKFLEAEKVEVSGTFFFKITFEKYAANPVTLYALHAMVPISAIRDIQLKETSQQIANDNPERAIFLGDWNITPFSPHFKGILRITGLQHHDTSLYPVVTWPTTFMLPILQIPIDQILFSPGLKLMAKERGPAMGSDHYPLIARFGLPD